MDEESAACNSIPNCNCSVYSYHSVARFRSALHQKHWHQKHLRWAPEQRRVPKAPFSASTYNECVRVYIHTYMYVCTTYWHSIMCVRVCVSVCMCMYIHDVL